MVRAENGSHWSGKFTDTMQQQSLLSCAANSIFAKLLQNNISILQLSCLWIHLAPAPPSWSLLLSTSFLRNWAWVSSSNTIDCALKLLIFMKSDKLLKTNTLHLMSCCHWHYLVTMSGPTLCHNVAKQHRCFHRRRDGDRGHMGWHRVMRDGKIRSPQIFGAHSGVKCSEGWEQGHYSSCWLIL